MKKLFIFIQFASVCINCINSYADTPPPGAVFIKGGSDGTKIGNVGDGLKINGSITATNPSVSNTGAAVPVQATYIGGLNSGNLKAPNVTNAGALQVDGSATTQPISAASLPLPAGAATSALQSSTITTLGSPFQAGGSIGNSSFGISGLLPAYSATPTFNLGTIGTAATSANQVTAQTSLSAIQTSVANIPSSPSTSALQTTGNTSLSSIDSKLTSPLTINLPSGAATSANQSTAQTSLSSIVTNTTGLSTSANQTNGTQKAQRVDGSGNVAPAGDTASHAGYSYITSPSVSFAGVSLALTAGGSVPVQQETNAEFLDPFDGNVIDTNRWGTPVTAGAGSVTQSNAQFVIATTTAANDAAAISSVPTFTNYGLSAIVFAVSVKLEASLVTGNYRFWGAATAGTSYSTTNPIKDGFGFEITTAGVFQAVIYANNVLIFSSPLSRPTDGLFHAYAISYRADTTAWIIDGATFPSAVSTAYNNPSNTVLPFRFAMINGSSVLGGVPTFNLSAAGVGDIGQNHTDITDGVYKFRKATVTTTGGLATNGDEPVVITSTASGSLQDIFPATDVAAYKAISIQATSGALTGTVTFQASNDNFVTTNTVFCSLTSSTSTSPQSTIVNLAGAGLYICPVTGKYFRARMTAFTSGSMTGTSQLMAYSPADLQQRSVSASITSGTVSTVASVTSDQAAIPGLITDVASAALTTTTTTGTLTPTFGSAYQVSIPVTVVSGTTPTLDVEIQESDDSGTNWKAVYDFVRITATGIYRSPQMPFTGNRIRYVQTVAGTTPSFTRSIVRLQSSQSVPTYRQLVDRSVSLTTLNSTTPSLIMENAKNVQLVIDIGATTIAPVLQVEGSDDAGASWYAIGNSLTSVASSTVQQTVNNINAQLVRVRVSTAGTATTANYTLIKAY